MRICCLEVFCETAFLKNFKPWKTALVEAFLIEIVTLLKSTIAGVSPGVL